MSLRVFTRFTSNMASIGDEARLIEDLGFDGAITDETAHDPFLPLAIAAQQTTRLRLMTGIAIGFARSPMTLANLAHDLNSYSGGRFTLGIGSQIQPHIMRRFSMPWSKPAARMREMVEAIRAIFDCWYDGEPLAFSGEFFTHNLMTPIFTPIDIQSGRPDIRVAAVGPLMTETAGAVGDGMFIHTFTTEAYIRKFTLPHIKTGRSKGRRQDREFRLFYDPFIVTGTDEKEFVAARTAAAERIAFYASTPAYRPVLEEHGWGELQTELQAMTREGKWREMGELITDEILDAFAVVGEIDQIAPILWKRYGDIISDIALASPVLGKPVLAQIANDLRAMSAPGGDR